MDDPIKFKLVMVIELFILLNNIIKILLQLCLYVPGMRGDLLWVHSARNKNNMIHDNITIPLCIGIL